MNKILVFLLSSILLSCNNQQEKNTKPAEVNIDAEKIKIAAMLDSFNVAAANSDYNLYFSFFTPDATFIGTDANENWSKDSFMVWAKPYFDRKKTWNFTSLQRNIYFRNHPDIAWFDELLNTRMKICRGSGVVVKTDNRWRLQQYVLSMTIPNETTDSVIEIKSAIEDSLINRLSNRK